MIALLGLSHLSDKDSMANLPMVQLSAMVMEKQSELESVKALQMAMVKALQMLKLLVWEAQPLYSKLTSSQI
jgi:hypothetical protein